MQKIIYHIFLMLFAWDLAYAKTETIFYAVPDIEDTSFSQDN